MFRTSGRESKPVFALRSFRPVNIPFVVFSRSHAPLVLFNRIFRLSKTSSKKLQIWRLRARNKDLEIRIMSEKGALLCKVKIG